MPTKAHAGHRQETFRFTADMIGSEILERFSRDIYNPKAIIRELVSNANDSYSQLEEYLSSAGEDLEVVREVRVNVADSSVIVADDGLGMNREDVDKLVSIALTDKRDMPGVRGYRGIGFWSAFTGGEQLVVETTKLGSDRLYRLTLNTKKMRERQRPNTSIGSIMNDPQCVRLESEPAAKDKCGTTVIIIAENQEGRLHPLVESQDQMKAVLLEGCACRLPEMNDLDLQRALNKNVEDFTAGVGVLLPRLTFQGTELYKRFPGNLQGFTTDTIEMEIGGQNVLLARLWYATNQENERLEGPAAGLRVMRDGFPVGKRNLDSDRDVIGSQLQITRQDLLDWHVGEVHLLHGELRPDASGEGLPENVVYKVFRERLRALYSKLIEKSYTMQRTKTLRLDYTKDAAFLATLQTKIDAGEEALTSDEEERVITIATKIEADKKLASGHLPAGTSPGDKKAVVRDDAAAKLRRQVAKALKRITPELSGGTKEAKSGTKASKQKKGASGSQSKGKKHPSAANGPGLATFLSLIDDIRDAIADVLREDETLQSELLARINQIVSTLGRQ